MIKLKYEMDAITLRIIIKELNQISETLYHNENDKAVEQCYELDKVIGKLSEYLPK